MKRWLSFCILCAAVANQLVAQRIVSVSGEYDYYAPATVSLEQAKQDALLQTRLHVLEAKFGTNINATTDIRLENNSAEPERSRTEVHTLAMHEVKGEWLEDTREPEQEVFTDPSMRNTLIIHTRVWGKAREIVAAKANVDVQLLKDTIIGANADVFGHEQNFYISFQSPVAGYLTIYLLDPDNDEAFCLLPAPTDAGGSVQVNSNQRYVFFSDDYAKKHYSKQEQSLGTEYILTTEKSVSYNQIYVIFSPVMFFKANDFQRSNDKYSLPRQTSVAQFRKWLVACKIRDTQLVESLLLVKIVK